MFDLLLSFISVYKTARYKLIFEFVDKFVSPEA